MIKGDSSANAQFGASLGVLGDVNGDGFNGMNLFIVNWFWGPLITE